MASSKRKKAASSKRSRQKQPKKNNSRKSVSRKKKRDKTQRSSRHNNTTTGQFHRQMKNRNFSYAYRAANSSNPSLDPNYITNELLNDITAKRSFTSFLQNLEFDFKHAGVDVATKQFVPALFSLMDTLNSALGAQRQDWYLSLPRVDNKIIRVRCLIGSYDAEGDNIAQESYKRVICIFILLLKIFRTNNRSFLNEYPPKIILGILPKCSQNDRAVVTNLLNFVHEEVGPPMSVTRSNLPPKVEHTRAVNEAARANRFVGSELTDTLNATPWDPWSGDLPGWFGSQKRQRGA